jgi:SWI/SNF-related matrix-associated actin-dependent regulator of chromatin subfamily A-like protein 1
MQLTYYNGIFNCVCSYSEKDYPQKAGFIWDKILPKTWATKEAGLAYKLIRFADANALKAISEYMQKATTNIEGSRAKESTATLPCPSNVEYLPFQKAGIDYIAKQISSGKSGVLLADEMGLGKTIQGVGLINYIQAYIKPYPMILIVCPASLKNNWMSELKLWLVNPSEIAIVRADKHWPKAAIYIVNYEILTQPCPVCRGKTKDEKAECLACKGTSTFSKFPQLYDMAWDLVIADESQRLKGDGKQASAFFKISTMYKLPMTGTPILSRPIELWSTLAWLDKATWGNKFMFGKRYCNGSKTRFGWDDKGASNLSELQSRLRGGGYMLRRLKEDVLTELPPKFRQVIELPSEGLDNLISAEWDAFHKYENVLHNLKVAFELAKASDDESHYHDAVEKLRSGQAASFAEMSLVRKEVAISKIPYVIHHLKDCVSPDHKVVSFCWHTEVADRVERAFGPNCVVITGKTNVNRRQDLVKQFQTNTTIHLFIGNMKAAGVGLTLTKSSHVVMIELDWVPANVTQAEDRCHRISQTENVLVQHLVLEGSLDAAMAKKIIQKQKTIRQALDAPCTLLPENEEDVVCEASTTKTTRKEVINKCVELLPHHKTIIHTALKMLSSMCDGARSHDGLGFSKIDVDIGRSLASTYSLSSRQAYLGWKLAMRHSKQLPKDISLGLKGMIRNEHEVRV